tara:strand:- start:529 stop:906 length:378 start_codon:yes stop_codon:yes gene_type:complete
MINKKEFQKVFDKLPVEKVELEKIELSAIKEIEDALRKAFSLQIQMKQNADKAENLFQSVNKENKKLRDKIEALKKEGGIKYFKVERMLKELGMKPPSSLDKTFNAFSNINTSRYVSNQGNLFPK